MNWELALLIVVAVVVLLAFKLRGAPALSTDEARKYLGAGAKLVDVRTVEEFRTRHLPGAINIPVDEIQTGITNCATDKATVILLHCRSGHRSAIAQKELRSLGYTNAFNLGSYAQAKKAVSSPDP